MARFGALERRLLLVVLVALTPLVTLSCVNLVLSARQQRAELLRATTETMRAMVGAVDTELSRLTAVLQALAASSSLERGDLKDFHDTARRAQERDASWANIVLTDIDGKEIVNLLRPYGATLPERLARPDTFLPVLRARRPSIGPLVPYGPVIQTPVFTIDVPVMREGELRYVLTGIVKPEAIRSVIDQQRVPPDGVVSVFDASGKHVARSRAHEQWLGKPASQTLQALMAQGAEGSGPSFTLDRQHIYAAFSRSSATGWTVAVGVPREAIDGPVRRSYMTLGVGVFASLALGLVAAFVTARSVSRPVNALRIAAQAVGRGERPPEPRTALPEVREVAAALLAAHVAREKQLEAEHAILAEAEAASRTKDELLAARDREEAGTRRLAAIIDSSDDAIVSKTLEGLITSWNRGAEHMFGWTAAEAIGRGIGMIIPENRRTEEDDVLARIRRGEVVDHYETVRVTKDGRSLNISLSVSPLRDGTGRVVGASKIARDVTERRRLEDERDRLLVSEQQARAQAEASNRAKDQLLATVSHELRTPLHSIMGWARLLQGADLDDAGRSHAVEVILRSASTQAQLVDDLLDLSRIVTGRMRLTLEECELTTLVDEALDAVRPAAASKGIALVTAFASDVGPILGAPDRLRQVVWNLAMNAVKFTPTGGRINVAIVRSDQHVDIVVADNGVGISPAILPHVFEEFRQEDSSSTRAYGGLGLGLALVKQIVELHGGEVHAQSLGKGRGATFTVTIPLALSPSSDTDSQRRS
jgi:PAS domain S-box-containing protein